MYGYGSLLADRAAREACARGEVFVDLCHAKGFPTPYDTGGSVPQPQVAAAPAPAPAPTPSVSPPPALTPPPVTSTTLVPGGASALPIALLPPGTLPSPLTPAATATAGGGLPWLRIGMAGVAGLAAIFLLRRRSR